MTTNDRLHHVDELVRVNPSCADWRPPTELGVMGRATASTRVAGEPAHGAAAITNLPTYVNPFVGREHQLALIRSAILTDGARLLTLTGPGGTGKTRLALQAAGDLASRFPDGVFVVWLAAIADPDLVPSAIARTLGIVEPPGRSVPQAVIDHLSTRKLLLVLDNFEHLAAASLGLAELLAACPGVYALVTSRAVLHLYGESDLSVPPLALPDQRAAPTARHLGQFESIRFFVERARAARSDFVLADANAAEVAEICNRLDGLPLSLELAAARLRVFPLAALVARMDRRLPLLTGGPRDRPARQRTLRDTIAWSYDLLGPDEQMLFRRLAVFHGCTLEAANEVCCAASPEVGSTSISVSPLRIELVECVSTLVDNSLLIRQETADGRAWYTMLETIREYAMERLVATDEVDSIHRRHALSYLAMAESADPELTDRDQAGWIPRLDQEYVNFGAALAWCEAHGYAEPAFRLAVALWWYWAVRGLATEGRERLAALLARFKARAAPTRYVVARVRATQAMANLVAFHGDYSAARTLHEQVARTFRELGDAANLEGALQALGWVASRQDDHKAALGYLEEALDLARARGESAAVGAALFNLAYVTHEVGDYVAARRLLEESMALKARAGRPGSVGVIQIMMGVVAQDEGELMKARSWCEAGIRLCREAGDDRGVALGLADLASVAIAQGDYEAARGELSESIAIYERRGEPIGVAFVLERFAGLASARKQFTLSLHLAAAAAGLRDRVGAPPANNARAKLDSWLTSARRALGAAAAASAWTAGRAMTPEQAISTALQPAALAGLKIDSQSTDLTRREREVASLIAQGYTNHHIGAELVITEATAASHVVHILAKLAFSSRAQIAAWAVDHGLPHSRP